MVGKPTDRDPRQKMIQRVEKKHRVELGKLDPKARLKALDGSIPSSAATVCANRHGSIAQRRS